MSRENLHRIGFNVVLITKFAHRLGIRPRKAFAYQNRFKALELLVHTSETLERLRPQ